MRALKKSSKNEGNVPGNDDTLFNSSKHTNIFEHIPTVPEQEMIRCSGPISHQYPLFKDTESTDALCLVQLCPVKRHIIFFHSFFIDFIQCKFTERLLYSQHHFKQ